MIDELRQLRLSIANVHERINGINSNLDTFANIAHNESLNYISENSGSILDVAELSDENSSAVEEVAELSDENSSSIEELAEIVDNLIERVEALEEKEN